MSYAHRGHAVKYRRIQKVQATIQLFSAESSELAVHLLVIVVIICSSGHSAILNGPVHSQFVLCVILPILRRPKNRGS